MDTNEEKKEVKSQDYYDNWYKEMGDKYYISPRIVKYIRCCYKDKYEGLDYDESRKKMLDERKEKLVEQMRTYRQVKIEVAYLVLREIEGLDHSQKIGKKLPKKMEMLYGFIDKVGYSHSIINYLEKITPEIMKEFVETSL